MAELRPLPKQGTIALTALASPPSGEQIESATRYLEGLGYRIVHGNSLSVRDNYVAGSAADRAFELHGFFEDDEIDAIFCVRGGFGTLQLLPFLDFSVFKEKPKLLVGYSDITALQLALLSESGMPSIHGFMPGVDTIDGKADGFAESHFWELVDSGRLSYSQTLHNADISGAFSGTLMGGNLSVFCKLIGTRFMPSITQSILFFEDIGERRHKLEGYLWQLIYSGMCENSSALLLGDFSPADSEEFEHIPTENEIIARTLSSYRNPIVSDLPFGHIPSKIALPFGTQCTLS